MKEKLILLIDSSFSNRTRQQLLPVRIKNFVHLLGQIHFIFGWWRHIDSGNDIIKNSTNNLIHYLTLLSILFFNLSLTHPTRWIRQFAFIEQGKITRWCGFVIMKIHNYCEQRRKKKVKRKCKHWIRDGTEESLWKRWASIMLYAITKALSLFSTLSEIMLTWWILWTVCSHRGDNDCLLSGTVRCFYFLCTLRYLPLTMSSIIFPTTYSDTGV